jgi:hypothetical protein
MSARQSMGTFLPRRTAEAQSWLVVWTREQSADTLVAGLVASVVSGIPSTAWSLARGADVLEGARAAGALLLPRERRAGRLLAAAVPVHLALSLGWAAVLRAALPERRRPLYGMLAGLAVAALDLGVIGRRIPAIRDLEQAPQWLDHAAYGLAVGLVLRRRSRDDR